MEERSLIVKSFMSSPVVSISSESILEQAEATFNEYKLTTAPILIDKTKILGVITDFQLLKCFLIRTTEPSRARLKDFESEMDPVVTIDENDNMANAIKLMVQSPNHRIYVLTNGSLSGALSPKDILPYLSGEEAIQKKREDQNLLAARMKIRKLMEELSATQTNLERYEQLFESTPFMVHSVSMDGKILMANPMLHYVLGYPEGELIGKSIRDIYPQQFHLQALRGLHQIAKEGFHPLINTLMVKKSKDLIQVDVASVARVDANGNTVGTVTISRISNANKMLESLSRFAKLLKDKKESDQLSDEF